MIGGFLIWIQYGFYMIQMGLCLKGVGMGFIRSNWIILIQDEWGKGFFIYWFYLDKFVLG